MEALIGMLDFIFQTTVWIRNTDLMLLISGSKKLWLLDHKYEHCIVCCGTATGST